MKKIILLILISLTLSGCNTNYKSLNDIAIVSSIIVDKKDDKYVTYIELYKEEKSENKSKKVAYFVEGKGSNLKDALDNASLSISKNLYFVHTNAVIFSKDVVNEDLEYLLNYFEKSIQLNTNYFILVTDDAEELQKTKDEDNPILGEKVRGIITYSNNSGATTKYDFLQKLYNYVNPYIDITLNKISVKDKKLTIDEAYYFNKQKIVGSLNEDEIKLINIISDTNNQIFLNFIYEDCPYVLKIEQNKTSYKFDDNKIKLKIDIKANLDSVGTNMDLKKIKTIEDLNKHSSNSIKENIVKLINKLKKDKSDILGINDYIYRKFGTLKYNFYDNDIDIDVNLEITKKGLILNTIGGEHGEK